MEPRDYKRMTQKIAAKFGISYDDAYRVADAIDLYYDSEAPDAMGRFDGAGADRMAGSFGWWAAWRESGCAVFVTNGGPMFADVDDPDFLAMIGEDADTDIFERYAI